MEWKYDDTKDKSKYAVGKVAQYVLPYALPYTNCNHTCPYSGNVTLKDGLLHEYLLPSLVPTGQYRLDADLLRGDEVIFQANVYISVVSQGTPLQQLGVFKVEDAVFDVV